MSREQMEYAKKELRMRHERALAKIQKLMEKRSKEKPIVEGQTKIMVDRLVRPSPLTNNKGEVVGIRGHHWRRPLGERTIFLDYVSKPEKGRSKEEIERVFIKAIGRLFSLMSEAITKGWTYTFGPNKGLDFERALPIHIELGYERSGYMIKFTMAASAKGRWIEDESR